MSVVFSGSFQGNFVQTGPDATHGNPVLIPLPSGVDWMNVYNETVILNGTATRGAQFYWRNGMAAGQGIIYTFAATGMIPSQITAGNGFTLYSNPNSITNNNQTNNGTTIPGAQRAITAISNSAPVTVSTANTTGVVPGSIVRIYFTTNADQLEALDFTVGTVTAGVSFTIPFAPTPAIAGTNGNYALIPYDPYWYPTYRYITNVSAGYAAGQSIITLSVTHGYQIGQHIRLTMPHVDGTHYGMDSLNQIECNIIGINQVDKGNANFTNTITVDIDFASIPGTFAFPINSASSPDFTPAMVIPIGELTVDALTYFQSGASNTNNIIASSTLMANNNILNDATQNLGTFGITLQGGPVSPAGVTGDVISWVAGKSFNGV